MCGGANKPEGNTYATVTYGPVTRNHGIADFVGEAASWQTVDAQGCAVNWSTPGNPLWGNPAAREPLKLEVLDRSQAGEHNREECTCQTVSPQSSCWRQVVAPG